MKSNNNNRRSFFKTSAVLGSSVLLGQSVPLLANESSVRNPDAINATIGTIQNLKTTHGNFTEQEIPNEQIELILQTSLQAANSSNMQIYSIVVLCATGTRY